MKVAFDLGVYRCIGTIVKENDHTIIVQMQTKKDGAINVKRHKQKHNVVSVEKENE